VQKAGIDYNETFGPVAQYKTVCAVLAVAAVERQLHQFNVKTAILYGTVQEAVYMCQSEGFNDGKVQVCKLKRNLYRLKQAPRYWNQQYVDFMKNQKLKVSGPMFICEPMQWQEANCHHQCG
jgi:hypothetical protein